MIDGEDPSTSEVISAMLTWYYSHNQNLTLSSVGVTQVKVNGRTAYMGPENFGLAADAEIFTISIRLAQEFNTVLLDTSSVEYQTLKQDIINAADTLYPGHGEIPHVIFSQGSTIADIFMVSNGDNTDQMVAEVNNALQSNSTLAQSLGLLSIDVNGLP